MATTHYLIGKVSIGSDGVSSITFSNIPQTYTDLVIKFSGRTTYPTYDENVLVSINGSTTNFSSRYLAGTAGGTFTRLALDANGTSTTANTFSNCEVYFSNYTGSTYKSFSTTSTIENNGVNVTPAIVSGLWSNTSAITSLTFTPNDVGTNFVQYTTASLYGISSSGDATKTPYASGGDVIATDGTYWIHTFNKSGTFTPLKALSNVDYLVVAGGGGGGGNSNNGSGGGGGGAGGLRSTVSATGGGGSVESKLNLTAQAYTVTVGAGGAGRDTYYNGYNGSNSVFSTITSTGGGGGGVGQNTTGSNGGSGGGGGAGDSGGGTGTTNQGYAGGLGVGGGGVQGGGAGGGAGAIGGDSVFNTRGGNGGAGASNSITGSSVTYAGGGGGGAGNNAITKGTGGTGGGGNGADSTTAATNGTANSGGGGGGSGRTNIYGANGGAGVVIVRYPV